MDIVICKEGMEEKPFPQIIFIRVNIHHKKKLIFNL